MNSDNSYVKQAMEALDKKDYRRALELFQALAELAGNDAERNEYRNMSGYALTGLKRYDDARQLYRDLYRETGQHMYMHQLGMVEREAGDYGSAAVLFRR